MPERTNKDPYAVFNFVVEIGGTEIGGFTEVSGLQAETETEEFREGGINDYVHHLVKITKYPNLTLKRGITDAAELWQWHQEVVNGKIDPKSISVVLKDQAGNEKCRWVFIDAYPIKWSGTDLNSLGNTIAVESIDFAHQGMKKV
jgi:phage tail-like protein